MKENQWLRLYNGILDDPKVQALPGETFKFWINVLCVASKNEGVIKDLPFFLRMSGPKVLKLMGDLRKAGLIDEVDGVEMPHNWNGRQFVSDNSTDRVRKHREKLKEKRSGNGDETFQETGNRTFQETRVGNVSGNDIVTPPETETDTDTEKRLKAYVEIREKPDSDLPALWKTHCPSLPQIRELTKKRKDKIKARLKEHPDPAWWIQVFSLIEASDFCKGNSSTGWKATFDWIIDNSDNAVKVLEGKYSNTGGSNVAPTGGNGSRPKTFREIDAENDARNRRNYLIASGLLPPDGSFVDAGLPSLPHPRQENA